MGKKLEKRSIPANILIYLILILLAVSYLYPLYFMGVNSLKSQAEYMKDMFSVDLLKGHFENYLIIFKNFKIGQYLFNTLLVTVLKLVFTMPLAIFASYAFAKLRFRGKNAMYPLIISAMFIPFQHEPGVYHADEAAHDRYLSRTDPCYRHDRDSKLNHAPVVQLPQYSE